MNVDYHHLHHQPQNSSRLFAMTSATIEVDDLEPEPRDRCNTWPLQRPAGDLSHQTSPLIHEQIPEEDSEYVNSNENLSIHGGQNGTNGASPIPIDCTDVIASSSESAGANGNKKQSSRKNAWGNASYADLITQAILSSPEKRLTLSQIYDWMIQNVPYFRDKGDSNSSAGWKVRNNFSNLFEKIFIFYLKCTLFSISNR